MPFERQYRRRHTFTCTLATRPRKRVFHLISCSIDKRHLHTTTATYHTSNISKSAYLQPKMLHKRKRSSTTILSSPTSDLTSGSTVQSFYPHTKPILSPFQSKASSFDPETPSHLNIRTRKRHRDNRPDAEAVHGMSTFFYLLARRRESNACSR